jgi:hypothetical protein
VRKTYQNDELDTSHPAVPDTVSVVLAELAGEIREIQQTLPEPHRQLGQLGQLGQRGAVRLRQICRYTDRVGSVPRGPGYIGGTNGGDHHQPTTEGRA